MQQGMYIEAERSERQNRDRNTDALPTRLAKLFSARKRCFERKAAAVRTAVENNRRAQSGQNARSLIKRLRLFSASAKTTADSSGGRCTPSERAERAERTERLKKRLAAAIPQTVKKTAAALLYVALGRFFGAAAIPFGLYPCGTALLCAAGKNAPFVCIGACLAAVGYRELSGAYFALNVLGFFVRAYLSRNRFSEPLGERVRLAFGLSVTYGGIMAAAGGFRTEYLVRGIVYAAVLPLLTYCFCRFESTKKSKNILSDCALCLSTALLIYAVRRVAIGKLYAALLISPIPILAAACSGPLYGLLFGLLCGACTGTLPFAFALGAGGFFSGMSFGRNKVVMLSAFAVAFSAVVLSAAPISAYYACVSALSGMLLYLPLAEYLPRLTPRLLVGLRKMPSPSPTVSRRMEGLSFTLSSVSDVLYNVSDKLRYPNEEEVLCCVDAICREHCRTCFAAEKECQSTLCERHGVTDIMCARLVGGGLKTVDLPEKATRMCPNVSELVERLNDGYARLVSEQFQNNKTEILASEYNAMARLIKYTAQKSNADTTPDKELTAKVTEALCHIGVRFSSVNAYGVREKVVDVHGVSLAALGCTAKEAAVYLGEKCGLSLTEPEFITAGGKTVMRFRRAKKIRLEYARSIGAKGGNTVSGDSVSFFENDEERFYALISDGMGSGRSAALTSRLTSVFVEKLLTTGAHKNVTLELLNDLLLSKSDESFATVDLLEIDLLTGDASFIKAGAAPAYILRAAKLYKIASCTPPAGIIRSFNAENTKFTLEPGDVVLMVSDGIIQSYDETPWLCEMLSAEAAKDPARLCSAVLAKAKKMNVRDDDMTCVAVRVEAAE